MSKVIISAVSALVMATAGAIDIDISPVRLVDRESSTVCECSDLDCPFYKIVENIDAWDCEKTCGGSDACGGLLYKAGADKCKLIDKQNVIVMDGVNDADVSCAMAFDQYSGQCVCGHTGEACPLIGEADDLMVTRAECLGNANCMGVSCTGQVCRQVSRDAYNTIVGGDGADGSQCDIYISRKVPLAGQGGVESMVGNEAAAAQSALMSLGGTIGTHASGAYARGHGAVLAVLGSALMMLVVFGIARKVGGKRLVRENYNLHADDVAQL